MFYERFIQLCDESNEKPTNVLKGIGVSSGNLNNWKNGTSVKSDILMQLSEHFNVSVDYLLGRTETPDKYKSSITTGDIQGNNNANMNVNSSKQSNEFDATTIQIAEAFQKLDIFGKAEVMNLITKLSQKAG